jgi:aspartate/methionine/tyrosine aminotransferase
VAITGSVGADHDRRSRGTRDHPGHGKGAARTVRSGSALLASTGPAPSGNDGAEPKSRVAIALTGVLPAFNPPLDKNRDFALASFLARWGGRAPHDLSASESATLLLPALLEMADAEDQHRWQTLELGYADPHGAPWLRSAIANRHSGWDAANVLCCAGAQEGLTCVMRALLTPGDHAVVVVPIYQPTEQAVTSICAATGVALRAQDNWRLDLDAVAAAIRPDTRLVLINFPNSPTGASIDQALLASLVELCRHHGVWLVNDEVYRSVGGPPASCPPAVAEMYERGISVDAVSKGFGLPGLRVGWIMCQDQQLLAKVLLAKSALSSCLAQPSEVLAHIALKAETRIVRRNRAIAQSNRERLVTLLRRHPDVFEEPVLSDAVLAFPRYRGRDGADRFARRLADEAGVLVLPSSLWHSPLATVPTDRLRLGLGRFEAGSALTTLDEYLTLHRQAGI